MITIYPKNTIRNFIKNTSKTNEYKNFFEHFKRKGFEIARRNDEGVEIRIYSPELAYILTMNKDIPTDNYRNSKETLNTAEFLGHFFEGFKNGVKEFQSKYKLTPDTEYGSDISDYLEDIKLHCFESNVNGYRKGWNFVRFHFPTTFKKELIKEYGFYSGMVRSVDELIEMKPARFEKLKRAKRHYTNLFQSFDGKPFLAVVGSSFRCVKTPDFLQDENEAKLLAQEIEGLMYDDKNKLISIEQFKEKTESVFKVTKPENHQKLYDYLFNNATNHINTKIGEKESNTGTYIDNTPKQIGNVTIQAQIKSTPKENIAIKIKTLESYLSWLNKNELKLISSNQKPNSPILKTKGMLKDMTTGAEFKLYEALIFSANEEPSKPIEGAYQVLKDTWYFLNSDIATYNGEEKDKFTRSLIVNQNIFGANFDLFFNGEHTFCGSRKKIKLTDQDFIAEISEWIEKFKVKQRPERQRKCNEFLEFLKTKTLLPLQNQEETIEPQQKNETDAQPKKKEYNTSQFNDDTYNLFCHIVDEYKKEGIIKYINIWYYLKRDIDKTKYKNILFNFTQPKYKEFVKEKYSIQITKFQKAEFKYKDDELAILQNITQTYFQ